MHILHQNKHDETDYNQNFVYQTFMKFKKIFEYEHPKSLTQENRKRENYYFLKVKMQIIYSLTSNIVTVILL